MKALSHLSTKISTAVALSMISAQHALAEFGPIPNVSGTATTGDIRSTVVSILQAVLSFMGLVAVVVIIIAGIRLVVAGADEGQREKAKNTVLYAVIGLVLILLAQAIVSFIDNEIAGNLN